MKRIAPQAREPGQFFKKLAAKLTRQDGVTFGEAQQTVALDYGFENWENLLKASLTEQRLAITMKQLPELNDFGMGTSGWSMEQRKVYASRRADLRKSVARVEATIDWLNQNIVKTRAILRDRTSYGMKHSAEKDIGYITNGVFIAAAIIAGYPYEPNTGGLPNVCFGMSAKSLRDIERRRREPGKFLERFVPLAVECLARRGLSAHALRGQSGIVWREDGDIRTLKIDAYATTPFIVRIHVDHYMLFGSARQARALQVSNVARYYGEFYPTRPKAEVSILPDEVETALAWCLSHDARGHALPGPPPFATSNALRKSNKFDDSWTYVWSERAYTAYRKAGDMGVEVPILAES